MKNISSFISHLSSLKRKRSFTLIELLVVIAIIAILAGMLLPSLSKVKARGTSITCISNLKNCAYAMTSYADTYADYYPAARSSAVNESGATKDYGWCGLLIRFGFLPHHMKVVSTTDAAPMTDGVVVRCPGIVRYDGTVKETMQYSDQTYGLIKGVENMGSLGNISGVSYYFIRRSAFLKPEFKQIPLGGDSIHARDGYQPGNLEMFLPNVANRYVEPGTAARVVHLRHLDKGNLFYSDGHVAPVGKTEITPETYVKYAIKVDGPVSF